MVPTRNDHGNGKPPRGARRKRDLKPRAPDASYSPWPDDHDEPDVDVAQEEGEEDEREPSYSRGQSAAAGEPGVLEPPPKLQPDPRRAARRSIAVHEYDEPDVEEEPPPLDPRSREPDAKTAADVDDDDDDDDDFWDDDEEGERPGVEWAKATLAEVLKDADRASRKDLDAKKDSRFFDAYHLVQWAGQVLTERDEEALAWAEANQSLIVSCYAVLEHAHEPARQPPGAVQEVQGAYAASRTDAREERRPKVAEAERKAPAAKGTRKKVKSVVNLFESYRVPFVMIMPWMPHVVLWKAQRMKVNDTVGVLALLVHFAHQLEPLNKDGRPRAFDSGSCRKAEDGYWWCLYSPQAVNKSTTMKRDKAQAARDLGVEMELLLVRRFEGADGVRDHRPGSWYVRPAWETIMDIVWETMPVS
jgi:hypothetical protein